VSEFDQVPVFVLCGGQGTRMAEETEWRPKPMVPIGDKPVLWHIMRWYRRHGFRRFVLCTGYKSEAIKSYFLNYASLNSDFTIRLATNELTVHSVDHQDDWEVTIAHTGETAMTGARIARAAARYLGASEDFAVTYGDGLTDADLVEEFRFHRGHRRAGTVLGVHPPSRFGAFETAGDRVSTFVEKPEFGDKWVNGGYFFFRRRMLDYLEADEACVLEQTPLARLAADGQLMVHRHHGFWQCMDTRRDLDLLNGLWARGAAPWKA